MSETAETPWQVWQDLPPKWICSELSYQKLGSGADWQINFVQREELSEFWVFLEVGQEKTVVYQPDVDSLMLGIFKSY